MNTTEDKTMKKPPTPSERDAASIAALEREVAGWMDASTRFQRERNVSDATLAEIEALLPPPGGDDQGLVSRVRRVVLERDADRTHIDVTRKMLADVEAALPPRAPHESGLVQRVKGVVARSAPRAGTLSPRDLAILAPLLDILDADLSSTDAGRALAAVRAVVGVERG